MKSSRISSRKETDFVRLFSTHTLQNLSLKGAIHNITFVMSVCTEFGFHLGFFFCGIVPVYKVNPMCLITALSPGVEISHATPASSQKDHCMSF